MIFSHFDKLHETNLDLAAQYMNSLSENQKKIELIRQLQNNLRKRIAQE